MPASNVDIKKIHWVYQVESQGLCLNDQIYSQQHEDYTEEV